MEIKELLSKIDGQQRRINEMRPLASETATSLKNYYKIGLTWSSNAMEGNTLTESETKVVIEDGLTIGEKPLRGQTQSVQQVPQGKCCCGNYRVHQILLFPISRPKRWQYPPLSSRR